MLKLKEESHLESKLITKLWESFPQLGVGSGRAGRVWRKYFILPYRFGFEEMKFVDRPLCGRIGRVGWSGLSGRERSGDRVLTISSNSKSNSNYKVKKCKKKKKKINQQPQISRSKQMGWRSHLLRRESRYIWWDLTKSSEISSKSGEISPDPARSR